MAADSLLTSRNPKPEQMFSAPNLYLSYFYMYFYAFSNHGLFLRTICQSGQAVPKTQECRYRYGHERLLQPPPSRISHVSTSDVASGVASSLHRARNARSIENALVGNVRKQGATLTRKESYLMHLQCDGLSEAKKTRSRQQAQQQPRVCVFVTPKMPEK